MSELISNPMSQPEPVSQESPALTGVEHRKVIRLGAIAIPSDQAAKVEDEADGDVSDADPPPDLDPGAGRQRTRTLVKVLADGVIATARAGLRGVVGYPRSSLAAGLSLVILGAIAVTQPRNPAPEARIPSSPAVAPSPVEKGREKNKAAKSDEGVIAKDQRDSTANPKPKGDQAKGGDDLLVSASNLDSVPLPVPDPTLPAESPVGREAQSVPKKTGAGTDPVLEARKPAPAPPPVVAQGNTTLGPSPLQDPAPAPSGSTTSTPLPRSPAEPDPIASAPASAPAASLLDVPPPAPQTMVSASTLPATQATEPAPLPVVGQPKPTATATALESSLIPAPPLELASDPSNPNRDPVTNVKVESPNPATTPKPEGFGPGSAPKVEPLSPESSGLPGPIPRQLATQPEPSNPPGPTPKPEQPQPKTTPIPEPAKDERSRPRDSASEGGQPRPESTLGSGPSGLGGSSPKPAAVKSEQPKRQSEPQTQGSKAESDRPGAEGILQPDDLTPDPGISRAPKTKGEPAPRPVLANVEAPESKTTPKVKASQDELVKPEVSTTRSEATTAESRSRLEQPGTPLSRPDGGAPNGGEPAARPEVLTPIQAPEAAPPKAEEPAVKNEAMNGRPEGTTSEAPHPTPRLSPGPAGEGWVPIPNTGKMPIDLGTTPGTPGETANPSPDPGHDMRAHADKEVSFEVEPPGPRSRSRPRGTNAPAGDLAAARPPGTRSAAAGVGQPSHSELDVVSPRVELVPHVVEQRENFWTISRLYYGSGRYYRALWRANAAKFPIIDRLRVGDVILIPPVEDLDPVYIDPPRTRTVPAAFESGVQDAVAEPTEPPSFSSTRRESVATARATRTSIADSPRGIAARRSRRTDALLNLPVGEAVAGRDSGSRGPGLDPDADDDGQGPAIRGRARSRASIAAKGPVYKIRPYDTLRSIARDTLGDAHRAGEILELNRGLINDPSRLIVGQLIELPEDADTRRATIRAN